MNIRGLVFSIFTSVVISVITLIRKHPQGVVLQSIKKIIGSRVIFGLLSVETV